MRTILVNVNTMEENYCEVRGKNMTIPNKSISEFGPFKKTWNIYEQRGTDKSIEYTMVLFISKLLMIY